jgi:pilus assembly protein CpaB
MRPIIFIAIFAISIGAMYVVSEFFFSSPSQELLQQPQVIQQKVPEQLVYVAKEEIPVGTVLTQEMLDKQTWPKHLIGQGFVIANDKAPNLIGMVARSHFMPREVILRPKLANPDDPSFLAATLPKGKRAVSVSVNGVTSVSGFVYPGDRVDVLLTHTLVSDAMKAKGKMTEDKEDDIDSSVEIRQTEIIAADVRVLAIDRKAMAGNEEDPNARRKMPSTVTLELTQADAQRLRLAEGEGEISLALRSLKDKGESWVRPSATNDLTRALPPGNFPELYEFNADFTPEMVEQAKIEKAEKTKSTITVVRGSDVKELEVEIHNED